MEGRKSVLKLFLLIVILVIPVIIYLFLRGFGENIYTVPIFFETGVNKDTIDCNFSDNQHTVRFINLYPDQQIPTASQIFNQKLTVVDLNNEVRDKLGEIGYSLNRVADTFEDQKFFQILIIQPDTATFLHEKRLILNDLIRLSIHHKKISEFALCELILLDYPDSETSSWNKRFVLIDQEARIRGYYDAADFEEIDRLILEIKIILEEEY